MALDREAEIAQNYCVRITGPGIDHQVMVTCVEDLTALTIIIERMRRQFETREPPQSASGGTVDGQ
jgi:hypothetical protein